MPRPKRTSFGQGQRVGSRRTGEFPRDRKARFAAQRAAARAREVERAELIRGEQARLRREYYARRGEVPPEAERPS